MRSWRPVIITESTLSGQQFRLRDDRNRQWFAGYAPEGSGFGYLTWKCKRKTGFDYPDLGYGFPVEMRKGPYCVLFSGQIVRIIERSGAGGDEIEVWALGWVHATGNTQYNYVYCDTRWNAWVGSETPAGSFHPDLFDWDLSNRVNLKPRRGTDFEADDYTYLRYTFNYGEPATRFTASYELALPNDWPGKLEIRDSGGTVLWSATATASGTIDVTTTGAPTYFEVRFYVTEAGENTADDDTVYGRLTNVQVFSQNVTTLDAKVVADDLVAILSGDGHGLSDSTTKIESPGRALTPCVFDRDMTPAQIMQWCTQFGDSSDNPLAWGVTLDEHKKLFLTTLNTTTVRYIVKPQRATIERGGDWGESAQKAYGIYTDDQGQVQRTADRTNQTWVDKLGGYYRRVAVQISGMTEENGVLNAVDLWLEENKAPHESGTLTVRHGVWTPEGRFVRFDEILPGGLVQIQEWRAREATHTLTDYRDKTTTFPLAGVRVDEDARTAELIPRTTSDAFARQMAVIAELRKS